MSERSQRSRHAPIPPGVVTIRAWLGSKHRSDNGKHVDADSERRRSALFGQKLVD
jgi:hypothetical protein